MAARSTAPALRVSNPPSKVLRALIESDDLDFAAVLLTDGARIFKRRALSESERDRLLAARNAELVINIMSRTSEHRATPMVQPELHILLEALAGRGYHWVLRSARDATPLNLTELLDDRPRAAAELCRDDDCTGEHSWMALPTTPGPTADGFWVWHLNTESGHLVPPGPIEVR